MSGDKIVTEGGHALGWQLLFQTSFHLRAHNKVMASVSHCVPAGQSWPHVDS